MNIPEPDHLEPPQGDVAALGRRALLACRSVGRATRMFGESFLLLRFAFSRRHRRAVITQMFTTGIRSLGVVTVVGLFIGMILALQTGLELRRFNREINTGAVVTVAVVREMGPFMTGLIVAASVGSAIAAQIGTMTVSEEVSALEVMSINPARFLVMPRLAALLVMMPLLTLYTNVMGVLGGAIVAETQLGVALPAYIDSAQWFVTNKDLYVGLLKAIVFGAVIATVACYQGFATRDGAVGVGMATRRTVIHSFLIVMGLGYVISQLFYE
jgi:phospholipid/cholesterol/gamma-HCH transport system permease protein